MNRGKLTLSNRRWKREKGKGGPLPPVHTRKLTNTSTSPAPFPSVIVTVVRDRKMRTALRTNQIAGFVTAPSWEKNNKMLPLKEKRYLFRKRYMLFADPKPVNNMSIFFSCSKLVLQIYLQ